MSSNGSINLETEVGTIDRFCSIFARLSESFWSIINRIGEVWANWRNATPEASEVYRPLNPSRFNESQSTRTDNNINFLAKQNNIRFQNRSPGDLFQFDRDVNLEHFKLALSLSGHDIDEEEMDKLSLEKAFEDAAIDMIVSAQSTNPDMLIQRRGFISRSAVEKFLRQPSIISTLKSQVRLPKNRLTDVLFNRLKITYFKALNETGKVANPDNRVLESLFFVFQFIKNLKQSEIQLLSGYLKESLMSAYFGNYSLQEFQVDLNTLTPLDFEIKYQGCFNGMLQNIIGVVIEAETLFRFIEEFPVAE